jgi:polysaccharide pyruvyl transferase WcaK-like protein
LYRFGKEYDRILSSVALSLKTLSEKGYKIINTTHITADKQFEIVLKRFGVQFRTVELQYEFPEKVFEFYNDAELVIGMRGHAQMIPYGLNTKIITLGSHDKMLWFLQDLEAEDWYIELQNRNADDLYDEILNKSLYLLGEGHDNTVQRLINTQNSIFDLTQKNIGKISSFLH